MGLGRVTARDAARLRAALLTKQTRVVGADRRSWPIEITGLAGDRQGFVPEWYPTGSTSWSERAGVLVVDGNAERCANALVGWHDLATRRAVPYFIDGDLIEHAWRVEPGFPAAKFRPEDLLSRYGFALLGRALPFTTPGGNRLDLRAVSWAPVEDCVFKPKFLDVERATHPGGTPLVVLGEDWREFAVGLIHVRLWVDHDNTGPGIAEEHDFTVSARADAPAVGHESGPFHQLVRALGIAFTIAQQSDVGQERDEALNPATVKRARAARVERYADPVRVMELRPRTAAGLRDMGQLGEAGSGRVRGRYRYVKICWPVRPIVDAAGNVVRRGGIHYRDRDLLCDDPGAVVRRASLPKADPGTTTPPIE